MRTISRDLDRLYLSVTDEDFTNSTIADQLLMDAKVLAFEYLNDSTAIDEVQDDDLLILYEFVLLKHSYLSEAKDSLNIKEDSITPFSELSLSLSTFESEGTLAHNVDEILYMKIAKEINYIGVQLEFCFCILKQIVQKRNLFNA